MIPKKELIKKLIDYTIDRKKRSESNLQEPSKKGGDHMSLVILTYAVYFILFIILALCLL